MAQIDLKVRRLETGETLVATLDSFEDAVMWLGERPENVEVLGVLSKELSEAQHRALRAALRPYTALEKQMIQEAEQKVSDAIASQIRKEAEYSQRKMKEHTEAMLKADPNRPLPLRWHFKEGLSVADAYDPREITDEARRAVDAWLKERTSWIQDRGQIIIEATLSVYPGKVPSGMEDDRVVPGGQFVPGFPDDAPKA